MDGMEETNEGKRVQRKWRKIAYGGRQPSYDDNYTDESFLEAMVMNANVVKKDTLTVMQDSVAVAQYICIVAVVVSVWTYSLKAKLDERGLLIMDAALLGLGFLMLLLTAGRISASLLYRCLCLLRNFFLDRSMKFCGYEFMFGRKSVRKQPGNKIQLLKKCSARSSESMKSDFLSINGNCDNLRPLGH